MTARNSVTLGRETLRHAIGLSGPLDFDIVDVLRVVAGRDDDEAALRAALTRTGPSCGAMSPSSARRHSRSQRSKRTTCPKVGGAATYTKSGRDDPAPSAESWNTSVRR